MPKIGSKTHIDGLLYMCQKITSNPIESYRYSGKWRKNGHKARVEIIPATRTKKAVYVVWIYNKYGC